MALKKIMFSYTTIINLLLLLTIGSLLPIANYGDETLTEQMQTSEQAEPDAMVEQEDALAVTVETAKVVSLHELTNEDLFLQFKQLLDSIDSKEKIIVRQLRESEFLLEEAGKDAGKEEANKNAQQVDLPAEPNVKDLSHEEANKNAQQVDLPEVDDLPAEPNVKDLSHEEANKLMLEYRQAIVAILKQRSEAKEAEKILLDQYSKQLPEAYTGIDTLLQDSQKLDKFALQVDLRIKDGSLIQAEVPEQFSFASLEKLRQSFTEQQADITKKIEVLKEKIATATSALDENKKSLIEAESAQKTAQERYDQAQKRQELERQYASKNLKQLHTELTGLLEDRVWLQSTMASSMRGFLTQRTAEEKIAQELQAMGDAPKAETEETSSEQASDADQLVKDLDAYHKNRLKILQKRHNALTALIKIGESLEGNARVLSEHIFKMHVVAEAFEQARAKKKDDSLTLPVAVTSEVIKKYDEELSAKLSDVLATITHATEQLTVTEQSQTQSIEAIAQAKQSLIDLKKARDALLENQKWETELKGLNAKQVIEKFTEATSSLKEKMEVLEKARRDFSEINTAYTDATHKFETLQDVFVRELQTQKQAEQYELTKQLYQFAGLEPPVLEVPVTQEGDSTVVSVEVAVPTTTTEVTPPPSSTTHDETPENATEVTEEAAAPPTQQVEAPQENPDAAVVTYQSQLSSWLHITDEKSKQQADILNLLNKLDAQQIAYLAILDEVYQLNQQQQATAIEVKRRVGKDELKGEEIPDGITDALKREHLAELKTERILIRDQQLEAQDNIARFGQKDESLPNVYKLLGNTEMLTGKLLDALQQARKLAQIFLLDQKELGSIEQKILEQSASRRIKTENNIAEFFFGFFESSEISILTEILQGYYLELIEIENKQQLLVSQQEKYKNAIAYLQEEKKSMIELLPLLQNQLVVLQDTKEEETIKAKARIAPDQAQELLTAFETEKGRTLVVPPPLAEEGLAKGIDYLTKYLFSLDINIQGLEKWISLFQQRTQPNGIDAEIGKYQDVIAELDTKNAALQRRIAGLTGYTPAEIAKFTKEEQPTTAKGWKQVKTGEIGVLRADRLTLYKENIYMIAVKLVVIVMSSIIVIVLINLFIKHSLTRVQRELDAGKRTDTALVSILLLLRKVLRFFIIGAAFILCLDAVGFNTGTILAGLGIGGIGIAMASKDILGDIFGGITIMVMGLYKIGDLISHKGTWYTVKEIGIRHTLLRDFTYGYQVSMPNGKLVDSEIIKINSHPGHTVLKQLHLATTNSADKISQALVLLKAVIVDHPDARFMWVKHHHFDDYSFILALYYDINEFKVRHKVESEINAEIVKRFQENGIKFTPLPGLLPEMFEMNVKT